MFKQIKLNYQFSDMEPYIDALTMETHYTKHHAAYTDNFNKAVKQAEYEEKTAEEILIHLNELKNSDLVTALKNNGGGFYNHNLYFSTLNNDGTHRPIDELSRQILKNFGSFDTFQEKITVAAMGLFGSGWAWLSSNAYGELQISTSSNQSNPIIETAGEWMPIMAIDVWEHAYYLKYKNLRLEYIQGLFHVIDWSRIERFYMEKKTIRI